MRATRFFVEEDDICFNSEQDALMAYMVFS